MGQALDIDIPPPRPKRKPSNPYPRKTSASTSTSQVGAKDGKFLSSDSSSHCKQGLNLEKEPVPEVMAFLCHLKQCSFITIRTSVNNSLSTSLSLLIRDQMEKENQHRQKKTQMTIAQKFSPSFKKLSVLLFTKVPYLSPWGLEMLALSGNLCLQ